MQLVLQGSNPAWQVCESNTSTMNTATETPHLCRLSGTAEQTQLPELNNCFCFRVFKKTYGLKCAF